MNGNGLYTPPPGRPVSTPPDVPASPPRLSRYLNPEQSFDVAARYERGEPIRDIAAVYGISSSVVTYHAHRHGVSLRHTEASRANMQAAQLARFHGSPKGAARPVRQEGEDKLAYARRMRAWLLLNDPERGPRIKAALIRGGKASGRVKRRKKKKAMQSAMHDMAAACAKTMPPLVLTEPVPAPPAPKRRWWQFWRRP